MSRHVSARAAGGRSGTTDHGKRTQPTLSDRQASKIHIIKDRSRLLAASLKRLFDGERSLEKRE